MKRCPQCLEAYDSDENFCELDGQELLADPTFHAVEATSPPSSRPRNTAERSLMVMLGVTGGVLISAALFFVYSVVQDGSPEPSQLTTQVLPATPVSRSAPALSTSEQPVPRATASPLVENELSQPEPESQTPGEEKEAPVPTKMNQGPISTGTRTEESNLRTIIQLNDGSSIDVDAAWKEGQGIWYRRGGLVSFIDSKDVKSISTITESKKVDAPSNDDSH